MLNKRPAWGHAYSSTCQICRINVPTRPARLSVVTAGSANAFKTPIREFSITRKKSQIPPTIQQSLRDCDDQENISIWVSEKNSL